MNEEVKFKITPDGCFCGEECTYKVFLPTTEKYFCTAFFKGLEDVRLKECVDTVGE